MIYGLNFNGKEIPEIARKLFKPQRLVRSPAMHVSKFRLMGVCNTIQEATLMKIQASNGHRRVLTSRDFDRDGLYWIAVYCD
jgi:hypothetical protein